ncbi:hypothetical protein PENSPDRAFT_735575 [Peniophora sp. CONT]|nr:hypothetical protein PENSPDRAFT_735575 [Peniophora sp. CONT]
MNFTAIVTLIAAATFAMALPQPAIEVDRRCAKSSGAFCLESVAHIAITTGLPLSPVCNHIALADVDRPMNRVGSPTLQGSDILSSAMKAARTEHSISVDGPGLVQHCSVSWSSISRSLYNYLFSPYSRDVQSIVHWVVISACQRTTVEDVVQIRFRCCKHVDDPTSGRCSLIEEV